MWDYTEKEKELLALFEGNPPDYEVVKQLLLTGQIDVNAGNEEDSLLFLLIFLLVFFHFS